MVDHAPAGLMARTSAATLQAGLRAASGDTFQPRDPGGRWTEKGHSAPGRAAALASPDTGAASGPATAGDRLIDLPRNVVGEVVLADDVHTGHGFDEIAAQETPDGTAYAVEARRTVDAAERLARLFCRQQGRNPADPKAWAAMHENAVAFLHAHADGIRDWALTEYGADVRSDPDRPGAAVVAIAGRPVPHDATVADVTSAVDSSPTRRLATDLDDGTFFQEMEDEAPAFTLRLRRQAALAAQRAG